MSHRRFPHTKSLQIGGVSASARGDVIRTVLGSCVAVCLRDPIARIGGMNHFMLPTGDGISSRYGVHAMEVLINRCMGLGASRDRLEAKVFGGGHVLRVSARASSVPQLNIKFALDFLELEKIRIVSRDLGGVSAREVLFFTDTGRVLVRKLRPQVDVSMKLIVDQELLAVRQAAQVADVKDDSNVTLFS